MTKFKISVLSYISETAEAIRRQILYTSIGYIKLHVQSVERTKFHKKTRSTLLLFLILFPVTSTLLLVWTELNRLQHGPPK